MRKVIHKVKNIKFSINQESLYYSLAALTILISFLFLVAYRAYDRLSTEQRKQLSIINKQIEEQKNKEKKAAELIKTQAESLKLAQIDLDKTKEEASKQNDQLNKQKEQLLTLSKTLKEQASSSQDLVISSSDISKYISGSVQVMCLLKDGQVSSGSGTLWNFKEVPYAVLTNYHVIQNAVKCVVSMTDNSNKSTGMFTLEGEVYTFNKDTDTAIIAMKTSVTDKNNKLADYNYSIPKLRKCPTNIAVGSPMIIIGYPAYAKRDNIMKIDGIGAVNVVYRTTTNGILSGYDTSKVKPVGNLPNPNYFTSAKIDSGNSGGIALSKDGEGMCVLGLSTWLSMGNYENQGLIQNIVNIIP